MEFKEGLTFDDVLLVPKYSDITSRSQTDLTTQLSRNISLNIPFVSANMDTVTESSMAVAIARAGGIGIIHRFLTIQEQANEVLKVKRSGSVMIENPYSITADKTIEDALDYAENKDISGLLVVDANSKLIGIVTERDLLFANSKNLIQDVMTKDVVTAKYGVSIDEAKVLLHKHRIEKLSLLVIKPFTNPDSSTKGNFSILCLCKRSFASSMEIPYFAVTTSLVITSWIRFLEFANNKSLSVTIPINFEAESTTNNPEISLSSA